MPNGAAQSITRIVAVFEQPLVLVYVIVVVPPPWAVTTPVEEMLATAVFDDAHGVVSSGVPEPVNCMLEPPTVMFWTPEIVGISDTFTVIAVRGLSQGFEFIVASNLNAKSWDITPPPIYPVPFA